MNKALVKDLARKRREYLGKKTGANLFAMVLATIAFVIGGVALLFIYFIVSNIIGSPVADLVTPIIFAAMISAGALYIGRVSASVFKEARSIEYVPPAAEQIAALPAELILVRGSEQPTAAPGELLRAAHAGKVDAVQELLRPNENAEV